MDKVVTYGIRYEGNVEPYITFDTEDEALNAFWGMRLKHQASEEVVRVESTYTVIQTGEAAREYLQDQEDAGRYYWEKFGRHSSE